MIIQSCRDVYYKHWIRCATQLITQEASKGIPPGSSLKEAQQLPGLAEWVNAVVLPNGCVMPAFLSADSTRKQWLRVLMKWEQ